MIDKLIKILKYEYVSDLAYYFNIDQIDYFETETKYKKINGKNKEDGVNLIIHFRYNQIKTIEFPNCHEAEKFIYENFTKNRGI